MPRRGHAWVEAGLARYRALGHLAGSGAGLALLGWTALGDYAAAEALCREAQAVCAQTGYAWGVQYAVDGLGLVKRAQGDYATAHQCFRETLAFCEQIGYLWGMAQVHINLGLTAPAQGEAQTAEGFFRQSLCLSESIEHRWSIAQSYGGLGEVTLAGGDYPAVQTWAQRGLALYQQMQDHDGQADCLLILSATTQERGDRAAAWQALSRPRRSSALRKTASASRGRCVGGPNSCYGKGRPRRPRLCSPHHCRQSALARAAHGGDCGELS